MSTIFAHAESREDATWPNFDFRHESDSLAAVVEPSGLDLLIDCYVLFASKSPLTYGFNYRTRCAMIETKKVIELLNTILLTILVLGVLIYGIMLVIGTLGWSGVPIGFMESLKPNYTVKIGLPIAAMASYGIVVFLLRVFDQNGSGGQLTMKFAGMDFTGPAGPVTLWMMCFLSFTFAIFLLNDGKKDTQTSGEKPAAIAAPIPPQ